MLRDYPFVVSNAYRYHVSKGLDPGDNRNEWRLNPSIAQFSVTAVNRQAMDERMSHAHEFLISTHLTGQGFSTRSEALRALATHLAADDQLRSGALLHGRSRGIMKQ